MVMVGTTNPLLKEFGIDYRLESCVRGHTISAHAGMGGGGSSKCVQMRAFADVVQV